MKTEIRRRANQAVAFISLFCTVMQPTYALTLANEPLFLANRVPPKVMLALSKDQQLYKKAYNDYSDLDNDGVPETTYKHAITYYGYFDPIKCYKYINNRFEPTQVTTYTVTVPGSSPAVTKPGSAYCNDAKDASARWSGNFLNWVSMSRMDAVRKLLYGGMRSTDTATDTVLERSFLPSDAHSWAKFYNGDDIAKLTPFTTIISTPAKVALTTTSSILIEKKTQRLTMDFSQTVNTLASIGDQVKLQIKDKPTQYIQGWVDGVFTKALRIRVDAAGISGEGNSATNWEFFNLSSVGVTFCNVTPGEATTTSQANKAEPLIRVVQGNFALWNANERWQCMWSGEINSSNGNQSSLSGIDASSFGPSQSKHGIGSGSAVPGGTRVTTSTTGQFFARVKACVSEALRGTENCRKYGANLKPVGLLQAYGETIDFGLMTGSYQKNTAGGVLRKAVGSFSDEVKADGTFNTATLGIVKTLNAMRIYGYNYGDGTYLGAAGDNCSFQLTDIPANACSSWGNPMSEIYFEALRYFAYKGGARGAPDYTYTNSGSRDDALGLPIAPWTTPLNLDNACSKLNVLAFNASVSSDDEDLRTVTPTEINAGSKQVRDLTNTVGDLEGITNGNYFIGKRVGDTQATAGFELCTPKTITALGDASGICPEGPTVRGSYLLAGLAHHARTTPLRPDLSAKYGANGTKVTSYGIQLASNTPQLEIPVPGKPGQKVVIQPIYRYDSGAGFGGGSLVDLKYVSQTTGASTGTGKVYLNWEDSEQGGDYDQDMWGILEWTITGTSITITTNAIFQSTGGPQGFGYSITGTTADGPHFHSGINGFNFTDTVTASYPNPDKPAQILTVNGCSNCQPADATSGQRGPSTVSYSLSASPTTTGTLKDPLWYLAKYGGFDDRNQNSKFDTDEWDLVSNITGQTPSDGVPDTYFLVTNPLGLETALERAFRSIAEPGAGTALASTSGSIKAGSAVYTARFRTAEWTGQLSAFRLKADGTLMGEEWEASTKIPAPDKRVILTYRNDTTARGGVPFRWSADVTDTSGIGADLVNALNTKPDGSLANDGRGADRLDYLRGDRTLEGTLSTSFRPRNGILGDIVNSSPVYVPTVPNDVILDPTYATFRKPFADAEAAGTPLRKPMLYVGANDGMLHAFDASVTKVKADGTTVAPPASAGQEVFAYVPSKTFPNLSQLTTSTYVHRFYVDGSPVVGDAKVNGNWKTVLVGSLGAGGRGIYALDVTYSENDPTAVDSTALEKKLATGNKVLWEFNAEDDAGLGFVMGRPVIRRVADVGGKERWAAIASGGYNNGDGKAYIYIIFLDGPSNKLATGGMKWVEGTDYVRLEAPGANNGFAPPFVADTDGNGIADFIYAGDLLGQFWKFDIKGTNVATWKSTSNRLLLFQTPGTQPITAAAQGVFHPTGTGFLLLFGTGKYLEPTDPSTTPAQSFYAIWDRNSGPVSSQTTVKLSELFEQVIKVKDGIRYIEPLTGATSSVPNWTATPPHLGWFMKLPLTGERSVSEPLVASRRLVFTTLVPSGSACDYGGQAYIMVVNPATGGEFDQAVLDINGDGKLDAKDKVEGHFAAGVLSAVGITVTPRMLLGGVPAGESGKDSTLLFSDNTGRVAGGAGNRRAALFYTGANGQVPPPLLLGAGRDSGRATWREVVKK